MALTAYRLDFYDTSGVQQATLTPSARASSAANAGILGFSYRKQVNHPGILTFRLRGDHGLLSSLADKWQIEVYRRPSGQAWARDFVGIYRQPEWTFTDRKTFQAYCPGLTSMLGWRVVNWPANTASRSKFTSAVGETIMKTLITYNATSSASTANGRKRAGAITGLSVEADGANGSTIDWYCHGKNLLETLIELADVAGGDYDLVKTSSTAWQFRWYTGQLGTDRTASVIFAMERGNMAEPVYREKRLNERTVMCVWGQGEDAGRDYVTRTGVNYAAGNDIEEYINATDVAKGDTAGLNTRGDQKAVEFEAQEEFLFKTLQAPASLYGVHYFLGDLVTAVNPFTGADLTLKVNAVSVSVNERGEESITPEFETA